MRVIVVLMAVLLVLAPVVAKKEKVKEVDPKECEVCISNLEMVDKLIPQEKKKDKNAIEKAISTHCTLSGFGSDWKPNPSLASPKDVKMCYIFDPIKKSISQPMSTGMPKHKVCKRLTKDNPDICDVKYPIKVEKKEGEEVVDYNSMKVKDLKKILSERGVECKGCSEKTEFVKKCMESERMEI